MLENSEIDDPFLKLFWEEQKKAASRDPRGMRWHPMMVRQVKIYVLKRIYTMGIAIKREMNILLVCAISSLNKGKKNTIGYNHEPQMLELRLQVQL